MAEASHHACPVTSGTLMWDHGATQGRRTQRSPILKGEPRVDVVIDFEVSNRCNARCHFCPRDQTPHQGNMPQEVFDQAIVRAKEYREIARELLGGKTSISLCGLGEPLLNRNIIEYVRTAKAEGFRVQMSSNGSLLTEEKGRALLDAGLDEILINAGDEGDDYEEVYGLPWQKTYDNIVRFKQMADEAGTCTVNIVLVNHRRSPEHSTKMRALWKQHDIKHFYEFDVMNRGGALFVDHMQYEEKPQLRQAQELIAAQGVVPRCGAPFAYLFIGYDAEYYLCCSDWRKETSMGSIFDVSFLDITADKIRMVTSRQPACLTCNVDPINQLTGDLEAVELGQAHPSLIDATLASVVGASQFVENEIEALGFGEAAASAKPARRLIPVRAD